MATYRAVLLEGKGGLDKLVDAEVELVPPRAGEVRIRVRATGAGFTDVIMRTGYYPYRPKFPFSPGYDVVGDVDAVGEGVTDLRVGQRVAALSVTGGCAEYLFRAAGELVPVPDGLDDAEVVALILNHVTAYQMIHRSAAMKPGQRALVTGANGGVGTALLELLRIHGVDAIGAASTKSADVVKRYGAIPIDGRGAPLDDQVRALAPEGVDAAFDGLGGRTTGECVRATKKGGIVVSYGFTAVSGASASNFGTLRGATALFVGAFVAGRRSTFYGITQIYRKDKSSFREDLPKLFALLAEKKIAPLIADRLPLLAAREAQARLEAGSIAGKLVLVA
ncbi:medium chain dehydrogenase/reductase family protein [soil metagenome]